MFPCEDSSPTKLNGGDIIDAAAMMSQMHAVLDKSRAVYWRTADGQGVWNKTSLAELGFDYISMDDGC